MGGFDLLLAAIALCCVGLGSWRGFGRTLFDVLAVFAALWIAEHSYQLLAGSAHLAQSEASNKSLCYLAIFVVGTTAALFLARFVYNTLQFDLGAFDKFIGLVAGATMGVILAHGLARSAAISTPVYSAQASPFPEGSVSDEMLNFTSYNHFINGIINDENSNHDLPTG